MYTSQTMITFVKKKNKQKQNKRKIRGEKPYMSPLKEASKWLCVSCAVFLGEQEWCSGESTCLPPMCPGFDFRPSILWVEFVVGPPLCSKRFFSGYSSFPLSSKTNISKFQFNPGIHRHFWPSSCELLGALRVNKNLYVDIFTYKKEIDCVEWPLYL